MEKENFLTALCRTYLLEEKIPIDSGVNPQEFFAFSKAHNLNSVCYCAIDFENSKSNEAILSAKQRFMDGFFDGVYLYELQSNVLEEIKTLFTQSQIYFVCFKGTVLRNLYPVPESRLMGDIDILIKESDRDKAKKLLTENGFACTAQNGPVYNYSKNGVLAEIHTRFNGEYTDGCFSSPFDYAEFDGFEGRLDDSFHLACIIAHIAHHFRFYGAGVRMILDVAVMLKNSDTNMDRVFEYLEDCGLAKFGEVIFSVCHKWFGVGKCFIEDTAETEKYLMQSGAFGSENKNKGAVLARRELEEGKAPSPFKSKLRLAFPSYEKLRKIDYIKFIDGRPWLMPYAWVYRLFYNLKNRRSFMADAVESLGSDETKNLAEKQLDYFKEIGIYGK
ncbi:MAG: nucleotidyltransferase family protein [Eubacterium sp.]